MQAKLVSESLNEYSSREHDMPWENWKEASKYILKILNKDPDLSLDELVSQCRGWVNNMAEKSRRDFYYAVSRLEKMNEEQLNEKFDNQSDPIEDMGIGGIEPGKLYYEQVQTPFYEWKDLMRKTFLNKIIVGNFQQRVYQQVIDWKDIKKEMQILVKKISIDKDGEIKIISPNDTEYRLLPKGKYRTKEYKNKAV
jgi:hypothetical protein